MREYYLSINIIAWDIYYYIYKTYLMEKMIFYLYSNTKEIIVIFAWTFLKVVVN